MPRRAFTVCTVSGCPEFTTGGRCEDHRREADQRRGTARQRGYGGKHWHAARTAVLNRDPLCVLCKCAPATTADHWPRSRRELLAAGVPDPDAPALLRGLCSPCHSRATAAEPDQAGGWARDRA